jgi:polyhydroxyalkanoate synthesis regulator phasin
MSEEDKSARQKVGEGIRSGIGVLSAFKDALEETIQEARVRGDLSTDKAKEMLRDALDKAQSAASGARERLDFATHAELTELETAVRALQSRVSALETSVFGRPAEAGKEESDQD